jgi:hypothetical protein
VYVCLSFYLPVFLSIYLSACISLSKSVSGAWKSGYFPAHLVPLNNADGSGPGLPDGLFSDQKSQFREILEGLAMEDVGVFYGHLVHFMVFCYILLTVCIVRGNLVYFSPFWYFAPRKIWQPWSGRRNCGHFCAAS